MNRYFIFSVVSLTAMGAAFAQPRRATFRGGGNFDSGKCTIEVVVDGAADVEIRGDVANLRNLSGQYPQWRRFECTGPMPPNPVDFRFAGVDGRGSQQLIRDPRSGGPAVVRIEDPDHGVEGYTFDITWRGEGYSSRGNSNWGYSPAPQYGRDDRGYEYGRVERDQDVYHRDRDQWFRGEDWRGHFFERVREDLEHVQAVTFPGSNDQYRLWSTRHELDELQEKLSQGVYDERELDDVIGALQRVVRDNRLSRRDRDVLYDDLNRLRDFRARHDNYGARVPRY
jgi:hypothetical protein